MTRPAGKLASMNVKTSGIQLKIIAWVRSGGVGFMRICTNIVTPMISGQTPRCRKVGAANGSRPKRLMKEVGSGAERSDPAEERCVAHLDGDVDHLVEREEDRDLQCDRPATGDRIDLLFLVELHRR